MTMNSYENCGVCNTAIDTAQHDGWLVCDNCCKTICKYCRARTCPLCKASLTRIFDSGKFRIIS